MQPRNKMLITSTTECISKKEGPTNFQKHRSQNKEKTTENTCLERRAVRH